MIAHCPCLDRAYAVLTPCSPRGGTGRARARHERSTICSVPESCPPRARPVGARARHERSTRGARLVPCRNRAHPGGARAGHEDSTAGAENFLCRRRAHAGQQFPGTKVSVPMFCPPPENAVVANLGQLESCPTASMGVPKRYHTIASSPFLSPTRTQPRARNIYVLMPTLSFRSKCIALRDTIAKSLELRCSAAVNSKLEKTAALQRGSSARPLRPPCQTVVQKMPIRIGAPGHAG